MVMTVAIVTDVFFSARKIAVELLTKRTST